MAMRTASSSRVADRKARCAIYTRKSSEEGLEQEFNSLDAQREACEAFIRSQKHEGWVCVPEMYDDGGISGATIERPALKRLLGDIEAGRIDAVVVYKVDRLTRSLSDFAKIVEVFDRRAVSFVSVTQQFNTTTSMGRLTLNMLLSFAQFEREVTGERIRDKIAASKKKGMWMGGVPPLGYDVKDRKLVLNDREAETVRLIYRRYAALGSVLALKDELDRAGVASKLRTNKVGRTTGGKPLARGALYLMLQNPIYRGEIVHKGNRYPGEHPPIIELGLWDAVQRKLTANRCDCAAGVGATEVSLLAGLIYDDSGKRMTPTHASKKGTRYRYYVSPGLVRGGQREMPRGWRVPAGDLERLVEERLRQFLQSNAEIFPAIEPLLRDAPVCNSVIGQAAALAERWSRLPAVERRATLLRLVDRADLKRETLKIQIRTSQLLKVLCTDTGQTDRNFDAVERTVALTMPCRLRRIGMEMRLLIDASASSNRRQPDYSLHRLLARAYRYREMVMGSEGKTMRQLAAQAGVCSSYFTRVLRLSFLAPAVVKAILNDRHPIELTAKRLASQLHFPIAWDDQRALLGTG
jgi:DNA invertase Pin-like site-specific DNA recombinase